MNCSLIRGGGGIDCFWPIKEPDSDKQTNAQTQHVEVSNRSKSRVRGIDKPKS